MKFVTQADIKEMNRLYLAADDTIIRFNKPLPDFDTSMFRSDDWGDLCLLTDAEINDVKQLWNELEV